MRKTLIETKYGITDASYDHAFWNAMRGDREALHKEIRNNTPSDNMYDLPLGASDKFKAKMNARSAFRSIASVFETYDSAYKFIARDTSNTATWLTGENEIPVDDGMDDFRYVSSSAKTLASILKLESSFIQDNNFDVEEYLTDRLSRTFSRSEDDGFINGDGEHTPFGLLDPEHGALTGVETNALTFDNVTSLFFSVEPEYRESGTWMMNDTTALYLRNLKDDAGNYLWRGDPNQLLGRPVKISNYMPDSETGKCPVAFGDFSYYWIVIRRPINVRVLSELFQGEGKIGYLADENLDGFLIRQKATKTVKVL